MRVSLRVPVFLLLLAAWSLPKQVHAGELSPARQAIFLVRVLGYDANLRARAAGTVNIGILAKKDDKDSERMAEAVFRAFAPLESATLLGLPVRVSRAFFFGRESLAKAIREDGIDALYVCSGLDASVAEIHAEARLRRVLTVASNEAHLKAGLSLGVFEVGGRNAILVNLEASREEGVAFGPELLRLATLVK